MTGTKDPAAEARALVAHLGTTPGIRAHDLAVLVAGSTGCSYSVAAQAVLDATEALTAKADP